VNEPRPIRGSSLPLFDRLAEAPAESRRGPFAYRVLDAPSLRESVRQDLARMLNTRSSLRGPLRELADGTVLDYGLPDFSSLAPASDTDRNLLAKAVAARISAHEPRLRNVRVVMGPDAANPRAVQGAIMASLVMGEVYEPVTFYIAMELGSSSSPAALT
jgi:type VI secretion system lysozyme-like protein